MKRILTKAIGNTNIILYGNKNNKNSKILNEVLKDKYGEYTLKKIEHDAFTCYQNEYMFQFSMNQINHKNQKHFYNSVRNIIESKNLYIKDNKKHLIILHKFQNIKEILQAKLRIILEKAVITTYFIIITNNYSGIIEPLRSRCLNIRIPSEYKIVSENPISIICIRLLQLYDHDFEYLTKERIVQFRELAYNLCQLSIDMSLFFRELLSQLLSVPKWTFQIKMKLIELFAQSEHKYKKSYRSIIHIESLFIQIYHLTSFGYYEVDSKDKE